MDNNELQEKIKILEQELNETKEHLKKYTSPSNMKKIIKSISYNKVYFKTI